MRLKVSPKPVPAGMTREPRLSVAVDGAEDLGANQGPLDNPQPPCRASREAFFPSVHFQQRKHHRWTRQNPATATWVTLGSCRAGAGLCWAQRNSSQKGGCTPQVTVTGSSREYKNGSKPQTTEGPHFWTSAMCNAFSITLPPVSSEGSARSRSSGCPFPWCQ